MTRLMRIQQLLIVVLTLGAIFNVYIIREKQKTQIRLLEVMKQQDNTIKFQSRVIAELKSRLEQKNAVKVNRTTAPSKVGGAA